MASNSEYEQTRCFNQPISEIEMCDIALKGLIAKHNLKEKFRQSFLNSVITGEERIYIENLKTK